MGLIRRIKELVTRIRYLMAFTGGPISALRMVISIRRDPESLNSISYKGTLVKFRGCDEQVVREVLVDEEYQFLRDLLTHSTAPKILDTGAHIGTFGIWILSINPAAQIISVEADPATYKIAMLNATQFVKKGAKWKVVHSAAAERDGMIVKLSDYGPPMSHRVDSSGKIEVMSVSLRTLVHTLVARGEELELLKVDIEGSEEAFLCAEPEILKRIRALVVELHPELCDTRRVRLLLENTFDSIESIGGRRSSKPLLYCFNKGRQRLNVGGP